MDALPRLTASGGLMKNNLYAKLLLAAALALVITACGPKRDTDRAVALTVSPAEATLTLDSEDNTTVQLAAELEYESGQTVTAEATWASSDATIATVTAGGLVTAVAEGSATVTAVSSLNATLTDSASITVNAADSGEPGDEDDPDNGDDPGDEDDPDNGDDPGDGDDPDNGDEPGNGDDPDNGDEPQVITVTIAPESLQLFPNQEASLQASVSGAEGPSISWRIEPDPQSVIDVAEAGSSLKVSALAV